MSVRISDNIRLLLPLRAKQMVPVEDLVVVVVSGTEVAPALIPVDVQGSQ